MTFRRRAPNRAARNRRDPARRRPARRAARFRESAGGKRRSGRLAPALTGWRVLCRNKYTPRRPDRAPGGAVPAGREWRRAGAGGERPRACRGPPGRDRGKTGQVQDRADGPAGAEGRGGEPRDRGPPARRPSGSGSRGRRTRASGPPACPPARAGREGRARAGAGGALRGAAGARPPAGRARRRPSATRRRAMGPTRRGAACIACCRRRDRPKGGQKSPGGAGGSGSRWSIPTPCGAPATSCRTTAGGPSPTRTTRPASPRGAAPWAAPPPKTPFPFFKARFLRAESRQPPLPTAAAGPARAKRSRAGAGAQPPGKNSRSPASRAAGARRNSPRPAAGGGPAARRTRAARRPRPAHSPPRTRRRSRKTARAGQSTRTDRRHDFRTTQREPD